MRRYIFLTAAAAVWLLAPCGGTQEASDLEITLDARVVREGDTVSGSVASPAGSPQVSLQWLDAFGGVWFSTTAAMRGPRPAGFSFQAIGPDSPVTFVEAAAGRYATAAALTVFPAADRSWDFFVVAAGKPPKPSPATALACRALGVTAAMSGGFIESLGSSRSGLRPFVYGLSSPGALSLSTEAFAAASAAYQKSGSTAGLERSPSLADPSQRARLRSEVATQVASARTLAPMCFVVADGPSTGSVNAPLDLSFAPADVEGFRDFLTARLAGQGSLAAHWGAGRGTPDYASVLPMTARDMKAQVLANPGALLDVAPWALHREYMDALLADVLADLSAAAVDAARSADASGLNWSMTTPVTAVSGVMPPSAYGGFDYTRLVTSADVLILSAAAPQWSWRIPADLNPDRKAFVRIDADSRDAARDLWRAVAMGMPGAVIDNLDSVFAAPAAAAGSGPRGGSLDGVLTEVRGGLADLMAASTGEPLVLLVYSPASIRAGWMMRYLAAPGVAPIAASAGTEALDAWAAILADLGIDFKWVTLEGIAAGQLQSPENRGAFVILPETWCIDESAADALAAHVSAGGTLVADNAAGLLDGEYSAYTEPPLDTIFGIRRSPLTGGSLGAVLPGAPRDSVRVVADQSARPANYLPSQKTEGVFPFLKPSGRGGTGYLNIFVEPYLTTDAQARAAVLASVEAALAAGPVEPPVAVLQGGKSFAARISTRSFRGTRITFVELLAAPDPKVPIELRLPTAGNYYNLRPADAGGEFLGRNSTFFVQPPASGPIVLALEPEDLVDMPVEVEYSAGAISVWAQLQAHLPLDDRLFHVEFYDPDGNHAWQFDRTVPAPRAEYRGLINLPDNASPGAWNVVVRDLQSGMASWSDVYVE